MEQPPPANPLKWILIGCGALAGLAVLGLIGVGLLWWMFSSRTSLPGPHGATVTIPPGAADRDVKVEIEAKADPEAFTSSGVRLVGKVWTVRIDGQDHFTFKKPVRVSLPFDASQVRAESPVRLSRWENFHWKTVEGSRVEGDRVVADVDHFSEVAPTQEDKKAATTLLDVDSWTVTVDIAYSGSDSGQTEISSYSRSVSRNASVQFRVGTRIPMPGDKGTWITPLGASSPEDQTRAHFSVNDTGHTTDDDHDRNGNVFHYRTITGGGSVRTFVPNKLDIDLGAGTYSLTGSVRPGKVVKRSWSTFGDTSVKTSEEQITVNYSVKGKLTATDGGISDSFEIPPKDTGTRIGPSGLGGKDSGTLTVTLTPGPPGLAARIVGPQVVRRVDQVPLDGTTSTGDIAEYLWTFKIATSCPVEPGRETQMRGAQVTFHALWDFEAELVVKDRAGKQSRPAKRRIKVLPREGLEWLTRVESKTGDLVAALRAGPTDYDRMPQPKPALLSGSVRAGGLQIGVNQCVHHPESVLSGHRLHTTDPANKTWFQVGYDVQKVGDEGPFRGLFYVSKQQLEINRIERVNTLLKNYSSDLYQLNQRHRNEGAVQRLFKQAKEHEHLHSTLVKDELYRLRAKGFDPGVRLEAVLGVQYENIQRLADESVQKSHLELLLAGNEEKVKKALREGGAFNDSVSIWLPLEFESAPDAAGRTRLTGSVDVKVDLGPLWNIGDE